MSSAGLYLLILAAALLGGGSAGLAGCFTVALNLPFLAVCMAHAAMAGAVFAGLAGLPVGPGAFLGALAGSGLLLLLLHERDTAEGGAVGVVFSLMLGLAFLGMGLQDGPKTAALSLMWGSLLFVSPGQVARLAGVFLLLAAFVIWRRREVRVLLFSRSLAATVISERLWFALLVLLCAAVITANLHTVGGLLLYSLVCNPAMAAARTARSIDGYLVQGTGFGAASAVLGFLAAWFLDLPVGACIVIASSLVLGLAIWVDARRRRGTPRPGAAR